MARKLVVNEWMSLDGVVQAPGAADEDTSGGFRHGGWHLPYFEEVAQNRVVKDISDAGAYLFGRRTWEILGSYWPNAPADQQAIAEPLNTRPKYVATRTLTEPLAWQNSKVLEGDLADAVRALKDEDGGHLHVIGSTQLVHALLERDLVDELRLMIDPLLLGGGKRFFADDGVRRNLRLADSEVTTNGVILATYVSA
jgi:dihydrofolate reductase